ncbi:hypothetical protein [Enterococcus casseliflavus]|uniref:Uncharacterized protein n=1 Tax=Enterococcus casseliflavus TaxID=37734 RepID=A0ABD5FHW3_ENTCA|nr:hypothetical protein [Enterococcus casseliflavus]MDT2981881.1 hypothetical protein [Enterococcus casseliflavus]
MRIAFHFLDLTDQSFKKVYFREWNGRNPVFCASRKFAKEYWSEKLANEDIKKLNRAESPRARTLTVRLEE